MPSVIGIDISLTSTGIALPDGTTMVSRGGVGDARLVRLWEDIHNATQELNTLAVIEDLPANAMSAGLTGMGQGVVRCLLAARKIPVVRIPPASLKMYATGKGNAGKDLMAIHLDNAVRASVEGGWGSGVMNDDEVDAWWLRDAGLCALELSWHGAMPEALFRTNPRKKKPVIDWSPWKDWME